MKNWAPMKTTANDSWTANAGRIPISPTSPARTPRALCWRIRIVRTASAMTSRPRFRSRTNAAEDPNPRRRVMVAAPTSTSDASSSAEVDDHVVLFVDDQVDRDQVAIGGLTPDDDLGHR